MDQDLFSKSAGASVADLYLWLTDPDPDPDPAIFVSDLQGGNKKFFCLLLFEATFTSFSKIKSHKEVTKQKESRFSLLFLIDDRMIRSWIRTSHQWIWIREAQKHKDPDPQHWQELHATFWSPVSPHVWQVWVCRLDTDRDPDPPKWCRSYRIRIHNTAAMIVHRFFMWQVWAGDQPEVQTGYG